MGACKMEQMVNATGKRHVGTSACAAITLCAAAAMALPAQTFTTLDSFTQPQGVLPYAGLVQGADGNLYGTTEYGGVGNEGTIFSITPTGALTTIHVFCHHRNRCPDGSLPAAGLIQASDGNFYGTTT